MPCLDEELLNSIGPKVKVGRNALQKFVKRDFKMTRCNTFERTLK